VEQQAMVDESTVGAIMLSVAMHQAAHRDRPFAAAQGDNGEADFIIRNNFETA